MNWRQRIPTLLTVSRVLLCPVIIHLFLQSHRMVATGIFAVAALTDLIDGYLARRWNAVSALGSMLDPLVDKLFAATLFTLLMYLELCPAWYLGLSITIGLLQTLGYLVLSGNRNPKLGASPSRLGKWSSALQAFWIGCLLVISASFGEIHRTVLVSTMIGFFYGGLAVLQIAVLYSYLLEFRSLLLPDVANLNPSQRY